jgi:6-phosphogluconolactonase
MSLDYILRFDDRCSLAENAASLLLETMAARQRQTGVVSLGLTGGALSEEIYEFMADKAADSPLDSTNVHLWWNWDYFVPLNNPLRNSLTALSLLGGAFAFDPTKIHPIPSVGVSSDPEAGADQYAQELRDNPPIDICLLEMTANGQIAGLFPDSKATGSSTLTAGIHDAPLDFPELITMTTAGLNSCREIWILAHGKDMAPLLDELQRHHSPTPAGELTGREIVLFLTDIDAASSLQFHSCEL